MALVKIFSAPGSRSWPVARWAACFCGEFGPQGDGAAGGRGDSQPLCLLASIARRGEQHFLPGAGRLRAASSVWRDKRPTLAQHRESLDPVTRWLLIGVFTAYGVLYGVHTLAPEIQPDALYYHLGLVSEYFRLGTFPERIDFYDILPQGMEMLYLFAFAFGGTRRRSWYTLLF